MAANGVETEVSYEDLSLLENDFDDVDTQIRTYWSLDYTARLTHHAAVRKQYELSKPLYTRRREVISKIPSFWALVFEEAPVEIERYIQPSDSQVFAECLIGLEVERFEVNTQPRSFSLRFEFSPNKWFEDSVIEKKFWYRRASDNWAGLVSEPVKIHWKQNGDLTHGLTDAAFQLWENSKGLSNGTVSIGKTKGTPEYEALVKKLENSDIFHNSFFTLFSFISARRWVSAEESAKADAAEADRRKQRAAGVKVDDPEEEDSLTEDVDTMVCPYGDDLAQFVAEDTFPNAIKYFSKSRTRKSSAKF
jgi:hypothetical protein